MIIKHKDKRGCLEVVCGSMFSGKSEELIRRLRRSEIAKLKVIAFKHSLDKKRATKYVISHNGSTLKAFALSDPKLMLELVEDNEVIGIDEVQFFADGVIDVILKFIEEGRRVIVAGLDLDFRGVPFGCMPALLAFADKVTKLKAVCIECGDDAHFTQRIINNSPARFNDPIILVGAQESYQARCRNCFIIDQKMIYLNEQI